MVTPTFNPCLQQYGIVPGRTDRPTLYGGESANSSVLLGQSIGYLRAILKWETGHPTITVACTPGPWTYTTAAKQAVRDVQAYFGITVDGIVGPQTWNVIDVCYWF